MYYDEEHSKLFTAFNQQVIGYNALFQHFSDFLATSSCSDRLHGYFDFFSTKFESLPFIKRGKARYPLFVFIFYSLQETFLIDDIYWRYFTCQLTLMVMKPEVKDRIMSHENPVTAAIYNSKFNQVHSADSLNILCYS